jgi:CheY-like chemotaxis protein
MAVVLVVDDDADLLPILSDALTDLGWTVLAAASAPLALTTARSHHIDVVLADVVMPDGDGRALEAAFRREPRLGLVPFVFMTAAFGEAREMQDARVLMKPFTIDDVTAMLKRCLPEEARDSLSEGGVDQRL